MNPDDLQQQVYQLRDERDDLQDELDRLEEQLMKTRQKLRENRQDRKDLEAQLHQTISKKDSLLAEVDDLKDRLEGQQLEAKRAEQEREDLRGQLEEERGRSDGLLDELDGVQEKLAVLEQDTEGVLKGLLDTHGQELDSDVLIDIYRTYVVDQGLLGGRNVVLHPAATEEVWMQMLRISRKNCEKWLAQNKRSLKSQKVLAKLAGSSNPSILSAVGKKATGDILQKALLRLVNLGYPEATADLIEKRDMEVVAEALQEEASRLLSQDNRRLRRQAMLALQKRSNTNTKPAQQREPEVAEPPSTR